MRARPVFMELTMAQRHAVTKKKALAYVRRWCREVPDPERAGRTDRLAPRLRQGRPARRTGPEDRQAQDRAGIRTCCRR